MRITSDQPTTTHENHPLGFQPPFSFVHYKNAYSNLPKKRGHRNARSSVIRWALGSKRWTAEFPGIDVLPLIGCPEKICCRRWICSPTSLRMPYKKTVKEGRGVLVLLFLFYFPLFFYISCPVPLLTLLRNPSGPSGTSTKSSPST